MHRTWRGIASAGSDFIYTKSFARPRSGFYLHKEFRPAEILILSTQRIPRGRDPILSTQTCRTILHGGDVDENVDFQKRNVGMQGRNFSPKIGGGTIWRKMQMFKEENDFGWPFYMKKKSRMVF